MLKRLAMVLLFSAAGVAQAVAGQMLAGGKDDFHGSVFSVEMYQQDAPDLSLLGPALRLETMRVEPVAVEMDILDALRYNLEPMEAELGPGYDWDTFATQTLSIGWDVAAAYGLAAAIGFSKWDWGGSSFHTTQEGWFGEDTEYLGVDKLGHAYTGYILSDYFTQRILHSTDDRVGAALTGGILGMGIQTYVEILDGFSENGFSMEDFVADAAGVGFSILRNTVPGLQEKLDFRMEYIPSGNDGAFSPFSDYTGQKYLLALKLSGFEEFEETPLRFVELHVGYFGRGFTQKEEDNGDERRREPYVAVGFNLQEVLKGPAETNTAALLAKRTFEYVQVPYTYIPTVRD